MIPRSRLYPNPCFRASLASRCFASSALTQGGRTAPYRRTGSHILHDRIPNSQIFKSPVLLSSLRSSTRHNLQSSAFSTTFKVNAISFRDLKSGEKAKDPPRPAKQRSSPKDTPAEETSSAKSSAASSEEAYQQARKESEAAGASSKGREDRTEGQKESFGEGEEEGGGKKEGKDKQKETPPPPPPHGNKSPWQVFTETLKTEFQASKEWNESTKALSSSAHQFTENESIKKARAAYTAASGAATSGTAQAIKGTGKVLGQGAAWTWDTSVVKGVRAGVNATGRGIDLATRPVRETKVYKTAVGGVKDVIDDGSSSRYGGWVEKEERRKQRELRELNESGGAGKPGRKVEKMEEDPDAGTNVTLHKDSAFRESWRNFKDSNRVMQSIFSLKSSYNESENPLVSTARSITDRVAGFFAENETAMVIKRFREMDPAFQVEPFLREMREYVLPEVLDAYVRGDTDTLRLWLSTPQFSVYAALAQQYTTAGLKSDGRILDIRHVDILSARMLDPGEIPVFIITCRTQEVHVYRNAKTNELAAGMEDKVQQVTYAIGVTRVAEDVNKPDTRGWRLIELQKSARDYI